MARTPNVRLPYPDENANPFYPQFKAFVEAVDRSFVAAKEDRNLILLGGGAMTWTVLPSGTGRLTWDAPLSLLSPAVGVLESFPAGSVDVAEGQCFTTRITRLPQRANVELESEARAGVDLDQGQGDPVVVGVRSGDRMYLRNGLSFSDGDSVTNLASAAELFGDVRGPVGKTETTRLRGALLTQSGASLSAGETLTVVPGANPRVVAVTGDNVWILREGTRDVVRWNTVTEERSIAQLPEQDAEDIPLYGVLTLGTLWVISDGGYLYDVSTTSMTVRAVYASGVGAPTGIVYDDNAYLWISRQDDASLRKFSLESLTFGSVPVPTTTTSIFHHDGYVWAGAEDPASAVYRVDQITGSVTSVATSTGGSVIGLSREESQNELWYTIAIEGGPLAERIDIDDATLVPGSYLLTSSDPPVAGVVENDRYFIAQYGAAATVGVVETISSTPTPGADTTLDSTGNPQSICASGGEVLVGQSYIDKVSRISTPGSADSVNPLGGRLAYTAPSPASTIVVDVHHITDADSPYTITATDQTIAVDSNGGTVFVRLNASLPVGTTVDVCDEGGAASINNIVVQRHIGSTIDGQNTYVLNANYSSVTIRRVSASLWKVV